MSSENLPVTLIGGYLGSGKTTLVNHLLRNSAGTRIAVLVNDFGDLPIDADLIESVEGDVFNLSGGCVCCSYGNDLSMTLMNLLELDKRPEHIVIETSGVALPGAIASSLSLMQGLQLLGIVVLVNAETIRTQADDRYVGDTIHRQLQNSDVIVLNKTDLLSESEVLLTQSWLKDQWPDARHIRSEQSAIPVNLLLDREIERISRDGFDADTAHASHTALFKTFSVTIPEGVNPESLAALLAGDACSLARAKGFVLDGSSTTRLIQVVGKRFHIHDAEGSNTHSLLGKVVCIGLADEVDQAKVQSLIDQL